MSIRIKTGVIAVLAMFAVASFLAPQDAAAQAVDCKRMPGSKVQSPKVVNFAFDSSEITAEGQKVLTELAERFTGNPAAEICVLGMADRVGNQDYNKKLAMRRAEAVADFLKSAGLKDNTYQVVARGQAYGDDHWIGMLLTDSQRKSERRVEVLVMTP